MPNSQAKLCKQKKRKKNEWLKKNGRTAIQYAKIQASKKAREEKAHARIE